MKTITVQQGQTLANVAEQCYGSADYISKVVTDNGLNYNVIFKGGEVISYDETIGNQAIRNEFEKYGEIPFNNQFDDKFRVVYHCDPTNATKPQITIQGYGYYNNNGQRLYNNCVNDISILQVDNVDFKDFYVKKIQIILDYAYKGEFDFGQFPECEIIQFDASQAFNYKISLNKARKLEIIFTQGQNVLDFTKLNNRYDEFIFTKTGYKKYGGDMLVNYTYLSQINSIGISSAKKEINIDGSLDSTGLALKTVMESKGWTINLT